MFGRGFRQQFCPCLEKCFHLPVEGPMWMETQRRRVEDNLSILQAYIVIEELFVRVDVVDES